MKRRYRIAVLDDYQNTALESADWSVLGQRADITVFKDHLADPEAVIERLLPFDVICVMRDQLGVFEDRFQSGAVSDDLLEQPV